MQVAVGRVATVVVSLAAVAAGLVSHRPAPPRPSRRSARGTPIDHVAVIGDSYTTGTDEGGWGVEHLDQPHLADARTPGRPGRARRRIGGQSRLRRAR